MKGKSIQLYTTWFSPLISSMTASKFYLNSLVSSFWEEDKVLLTKFLLRYAWGPQAPSPTETPGRTLGSQAFPCWDLSLDMTQSCKRLQFHYYFKLLKVQTSAQMHCNGGITAIRNKGIKCDKDIVWTLPP